MGSFMIYTGHQILLWCPNKEEGNGQGMWHVWETGEVQYKVLVGRAEGKKSLEDLGVDGRMILKWILMQ